MASRSTLCLALKAASLHGQVDVARLLLDAGADVSARDEHGDSQAHFAVFECVLVMCLVAALPLAKCKCTFNLFAADPVKALH